MMYIFYFLSAISGHIKLVYNDRLHSCTLTLSFPEPLQQQQGGRLPHKPSWLAYRGQCPLPDEVNPLDIFQHSKTEASKDILVGRSTLFILSMS